MGFRAALLLAALAADCTGARAEDGVDCLGYGALAASPALAIGRVGPEARTFFVRNGSDAKGCPAATDACRAKAFLVPGDRVIMGAVRGPFVCVDYIGAKGADRAGWLPAAAVTAEPTVPVAPADWAGTWEQIEATVTLKASGDDLLTIKGEATYGALDPDRVARGAVNSGEIEGRLKPDGDRLAFAMGETTTLPVGKGGAFDCKVWMRRLGPYLLVDDNNNCGGMNVSFRGAYRRRG